MAFKLTKEQSANLAKLIDDLTGAKTKVDETVSNYNNEVEKLRNPVEESVEEYNEILKQVVSLATDVSTKAEEEFGDKSERWQEGEAGEAAREWIDAWAGIELDAIDFEWPERLEIDVPTHDADLEELPQDANDLG